MLSTKLVAILNITPNSFSDGGLYLDSENAKKQLELLLKYEPAVIDIGAISTRPNSAQPTIEEEIARYDQVLSTIIPILKNTEAKISIDSYNFETLEYLSQHIPIHWINDQKGFLDERLIDLAKKINAKLVIMHHLTIPADPNICINDDIDVIKEVKTWLLEKAKYLISKGISQDKIILDPGIGFNKTHEQSWQLIKEAKQIMKLGFEVMYGYSRKSFLNTITEKDFSKRDLETAIISSYLAQMDVDYLRIHDMESNIQALRISDCLRS